MIRRLLLLIVLLSQLACAQTAKTVQNSVTYPEQDWESVTNVNEYGWDEKKLEALRKFIIDSAQTTGIVVIQHGRVIFNNGNIEELSYLASCRKSVLSMLYGPFVKNGTINLDETIEQLGLDDIGGLLPIEKKATIKHLLTARSGVYHLASNPGDATDRAPKRGTVEPGRFWLYNNWDFNIAGYIIEKETGRSIYRLIDSILAKPLQMQDWKIDAQRKSGDTTRSKYLAYHMWFSTRDMARIGYLMLRNGKWKNQQIIPSDWIKTTTTPVTTLKEAEENKTAYYQFGYGYLWWPWDAPYNKGVYEGAYTASGAFGQFITVLPKLDLVIAHKTNPDSGRQVSMDVYLKILDKLIASRKNIGK